MTEPEALYAIVKSNRELYMDLIQDETPWIKLSKTSVDFSLSAAVALDVLFGRRIFVKYISKYYPYIINHTMVVYTMVQELHKLQSGTLASTIEFFLSLNPEAGGLSELYDACTKHTDNVWDVIKVVQQLRDYGVPHPEIVNTDDDDLYILDTSGMHYRLPPSREKINMIPEKYDHLL